MVCNYGAGDDATRLTNSRVSAENWTSSTDLPAAYVETQYNLEGNVHTATVVGDPSGTVYKESYGTGWQKGLVTATETWGKKDPEHAVELQRWTSTSWIQDDSNPNATYRTNPRVIATDVSDNSNYRHTEIGYQTFILPFSNASCSLPNDVSEYAAVGTPVLRRSHTDYNLDANYLNLRIIGLPQAKLLYEGPSTLMAKTTYLYDWSGEYLQGLPATPTQHDGSYSTDLMMGPKRANLVKMQRWDVNYPTDSTKVTESKSAYDITGNVIFTRDALDHQTTITYTDQFAANGGALDAPRSFSTFAYPTTITDADNNSSSVRYRYDFGAKTLVQGPPPQNQTIGLEQTLRYDSATRIQQVTIANTGAYSRYLYGPANVVTLSSVNFVGDEAYTNTTFDGLGRSIGVATNNPGSSGGYKAQMTEYDLMGRVMKQSNPTEINGSWVPAGDDAGWLSTEQTYDWKGRPLETINQDSTIKYASYDGCGCAGGEVVTVTDEMGRPQKAYSDVLGRQWKTEVLDANSNVYSSTAAIYNARDQITALNSYKGAANGDLSCPSGTCMQSVTSYDGHSRVATQKLPQQTAATSYEYNADDTVKKVTDPRAVIATNSFNNRHLLTGVSYTPAGDVPALASVSFAYDAAGNRTSTSDGTGNTNYVYNQLSCMTSETHYIGDLGTSYALSYGYNLAGELTSITDPSSAQVSYNYDSTGRLMTMPASGYTGVTNFVSNAQYRASGAIKHQTYGNNVQLNLTYNSRMQIGQYQVSSTNFTTGATMNYYDDGRTNTAFDLSDNRFDRKYEFDFSARLREAYSGLEAHGSSPPPLDQANSPYRQSYTYDEWNNVTGRNGRVWTQSDGDLATYGSNNRNGNFQYDAAGNVWATGDGNYDYDAAGRPFTFTSLQTWQVHTSWPSNHPNAPALETADTFDGAGQVVKHLNHTRHDDSYDSGGGNIVNAMTDTTTTSYYVHSTVLGGKTIEELDQNGAKTKGYVYSGGARVATQFVSGGTNAVEFDSTNPVTGAVTTSDTNGSYAARQEPDPLSRDLTAPPDPQVVIDPLSVTAPGGDRVMPIEASWGPSEEYEQGNAWWANQMDAMSVREALKNNFRATWDWILHKNPNVGIKTDKGRTVYGSDAADYLTSGGGMNDELAQFGITTKDSLLGAGNSQDPVVVRGHIIDDPQTPCHIMADVAQDIANSVDPDNYRKALAQFDRDFSYMYIGGPLTDIFQANKYKGGDGRNINKAFPFTGGDGFRNEYKDSGSDPDPLQAGPKADQTHHFAAFLSLGINQFKLAEIYQNGIFRKDNQGDLNLSAAAYALGTKLYFQKNDHLLKNVGLYIRRNICAGRGHGLYKN
jgi:YD repeat-containing protein